MLTPFARLVLAAPAVTPFGLAFAAAAHAQGQAALALGVLGLSGGALLMGSRTLASARRHLELFRITVAAAAPDRHGLTLALVYALAVAPTILASMVLAPLAIAAALCAAGAIAAVTGAVTGGLFHLHLAILGWRRFSILLPDGSTRILLSRAGRAPAKAREVVMLGPGLLLDQA